MVSCGCWHRKHLASKHLACKHLTRTCVCGPQVLISKLNPRLGNAYLHRRSRKLAEDAYLKANEKPGAKVPRKEGVASSRKQAQPQRKVKAVHRSLMLPRTPISIAM